jgi:hypothetical protein
MIDENHCCNFVLSRRTVEWERLNHLMELNIIKRNGTKNDPKQTYEMI